jgi:transcriptional regulator with XRE-family HTH domain
MSFGQNLEKVRKERKISQAKLGNALGITQQMISSYEKDISSPNIESLVKIADYFEVSIDSLIGHEVKPTITETQRNTLLHMFDSFTIEDRDRCLIILKTLLLDREENLDLLLQSS